MRENDCTLHLYIIRHAQSVANACNDKGYEKIEIDYPEHNPPLSPLGIKQAQAAGERLKDVKFDAIYISPYTRTQQTAHEIIKFHPDAHTEICNELVEVDTVLLENGQFGDAEEFDDEIEERADRLLKSLRRKYHNGENVLLVTHALFMEFITNKAFNVHFRHDKRISVYNTGITKINFYPDEIVKIVKINDTQHILPLEGDRLFYI